MTAHIETIRDDGRDNPFKPGTELSWEADLIVRLYKKGHPLSEVPLLLESIKKQLEQKKSFIDLDAANLHRRSNLSQNEVNNNDTNEAVIVNKSKTVSNDLCNVADSNLPKLDITTSEKNIGTKVPIDDELIERIITNLNERVDCENGDQENQENYTNIQLEEKKSSNVKSKLPPAIVNIPRKSKKSLEDSNITDSKTNETKTKQLSPTLDPVNKRKTSKSKTKKGRSVRDKNNSNKTESNSPLDDDNHYGNQAVDVKRHNCCSIQ